MSHDAAREWIDDAFLAPGMRDDADAAARAARAHLASCAECGAYDQATRRAALKLDMAKGPSPEVRTRTLAAAHRLARARSEGAVRAASTRAGGSRTWRLAALVLVMAVVGAGAGAWWANAARPGEQGLAQAVAMMSTLKADPAAHEVVLRDAAGTANGMAVMSAATHEIAVFAMHLPSADDYTCYLEHDGERTRIGRMYTEAGVQFWAGEVDDDVEMHPGDMLIVAEDETSPAVLTAIL